MEISDPNKPLNPYGLSNVELDALTMLASRVPKQDAAKACGRSPAWMSKLLQQKRARDFLRDTAADAAAELFAVQQRRELRRAGVPAERLDRRQRIVAETQAGVLRGLFEHANVRMGDFFTVEPAVAGADGKPCPTCGRAFAEYVRLDIAKAIREGKDHLIKKYKMGKDGDEAIEVVDAQGALNSIAKIFGMTNEEGSTSPGTDFWPRFFAALPQEHVKAVHLAMLQAMAPSLDTEAKPADEGAA